jgi:Tol biopolymer transport system component/tRNA A-37 threonylcarbamoyl transferase component Bud32
MKTEWWAKIESAYHRARDLGGEERSQFLDEVCGTDDFMRRQIEALLQQGDNPNSLLNRPAVELAAEWPSLARGLTMLRGTRVGAYEILEPVGSGGMGDVYRARDTKLHRDVALKVLSVHLATDPDRLSRLRREAQMLAALNHPNIAQIYGLEEFENTPCIAMELVDGETLAERVRSGPMPVDETLSIARAIAEALEAAHEKGIVHRDLKPANVMVTLESQVKVLDFGLAKALEPASAVAGDATVEPTITSPTMARMGIILGTPAYMSPEQAKGLAADKRSDVWAFGCVLYELLTGKRAFEGEDVSETLAFVISKEPDWSALPERTSPGIRRLLGRCLQRDRKRRLRDIGDARIEIEDATAEPEAVAPRRRARVLWIAALAMAITGGFVGGGYFLSTPGQTAETRLDIVTPPYPVGDADRNTLALSPDGRQLAFVSMSDAKTRLWLRPLGSGRAQPLLGTDGASYPFWSPDSQSIGFFADGKLKRTDLIGGLPQTLASVQAPAGGTWNDDDVIIFSDQGFRSFGQPLRRVSASAGGQPVPVATPDKKDAVRHPQFLPDGRRFLFESTTAFSTVYVASLDSADARRLIQNVGIGVVFVPPDILLFTRGPERTLFAQRFDTEKLELAGEPVPVAQEVLTVTASATGVLAYRTGPTGRGEGWTWVDRSGTPAGEAQPLGAAPELSPDDRWLAFQRTGEFNVDVWLMEVARGVPTRFVSHDANDGQPIWSPDGRDIVFSSSRKGILNLYRKPVDRGNEEVLFESAEDKFALDWCRCPSGEFILFRTSGNPQTGNDLFAVSTAADHNKVTVANTRFTESDGRFSPDGRWVAYASNETSRSEIYLQPFPGPGRKRQISKDGGLSVRWRRDGTELFVLTLDGKMIAVPVTLSSNGQDFGLGEATTLFERPLPTRLNLERNKEFVVSSNGHRFLMPVPRELLPTEPIRVILHWRLPRH